MLNLRNKLNGTKVSTI